MMRSRSLVALVSTSVLALVSAVGCAAGSDDADLAEADLATHPAEEDAGSGSVPMPSSGDSQGGDTSDAGAAGGDTSDAGGSSGNNGGNNNNGGNTGTTSCAATNACAASQDLGSVSGDTGADVKTASGSTSEWLKIKVTENDSGAAGVSMMAKITLTSPPGANFDLFVYKGTGSSVECSAVKKSSASTTGTDTVSLEWGETGLFSNGSSDDAFLTVEVRNVSGTCSTNATWSLTVAGDTN